jgi:tRNA pseudouridine65 synthase
VHNGGVLPILFQDDHLVAVDKPAGLLVHRTKLDAHERRFAIQVLRGQLGRRVFAAHRLDKGASGALLFAFTREGAGALGGMFARRQVGKTYLAVVRGHPPEAGAIDHPLTLELDDAERGAGPGREPAGTPRDALTHYRRLATVELPHRVDRYPTCRYALLELEPATGRRHQLRRHLSHVSHPIIGDATYGKGRHNRYVRTLAGSPRLLLACVELRLDHPVTREPLVLTAPLSGEFGGLVRRWGWTDRIPARWLSLDPQLVALR